MPPWSPPSFVHPPPIDPEENSVIEDDELEEDECDEDELDDELELLDDSSNALGVAPPGKTPSI